LISAAVFTRAGAPGAQIDNGAAITLTLYTEGDAAAAIALDPVRMVGLAAKLIAAALPKLGT
jgi:hypothetical protein